MFYANELFLPEDYEYYRWKLTDLGYVYDGDSIKKVSFSRGFGDVSTKRDLRLFGVNTPEVRGPEREAGLVVKSVVAGLLGECQSCYFYSFPDHTHKYGEILCSLWLGSGLCVNAFLVNEGLAKPYFGGRKEIWTEKELSAIINRQLV